MFHPKIVLSVVALLPSLTLRAQLEPPTQAPLVSAIQVKPSLVEADKMLANWLMVGCNNEVAIARIAVRRAHSIEVKQFAQKMLTDHAQLAAELLPFAGTVAKVGNVVGVPGKDADAKKGGRESADAGSRRSPVAKGEFDHIALIRDLSQRYLESHSKMLEGKTGAEFDQSFMQAQVGLHTEAVIKVEVFGNYASGELRPTLELAGTRLRAHLEQAMTLCKKCDSGAKIGSKPLDDQK